MPAPQLSGKIRARERPTYSDMLWEQLQDTKTEARETRKELNGRMDRVEEELKSTRKELNGRMDKIEEELKSTRKELNGRMDKIENRLDKQDKKFDKLSDKIDDLSNVIKSSSNHGNIMTATTISIALGVLYALIFK